MERQGVDHLADERSKAEFDVDAMKIVWAGSQHAFDLADRMSKLVSADPVFQKDSRTMLDRKDLFKTTLRKAAYAFKRINELNLTYEEATKLRFFMDESNYMSLHWAMFVPAIKGQGTEEQQEKWLPLAQRLQIIGCYAQTELGHGSNIQGLETTATFDSNTDEFIIHSPTLTSSKWWPGGLGKVSTHAVVYARLMTEGQYHGVHGFVVQLRSLEDHLPLPGITVGDIGTKFGNGAYNTMDNGVLRFDHVRIPRNQMLMRVLQVSREGKCTYSDVPRQLIYGTMVYVRQTIVTAASTALSRAVTIATRYSCVRRQFGSQNGGPETREAHACTSGLKSLTTSATADAIEECRKLCGGHGYLCSSGLPELFAVYVPACTYEGDNTVLLLQVARFLMKTVSQLGSGIQPVGTTAYMGRAKHLMKCCSTVERAEDWLEPTPILEAFEARAMRMAASCAQNMAIFSNPEKGFAEMSADLAEVAVAHCQLIVVSKFIDKLKQEVPGKGVKRQLKFLCNIYALSLLHKHQGEFLATSSITAEQASLATAQLRNLYSQVRPNAVALVDSFNYTDHYLGSILGRYDGNVYPKLYEAAWKDPLNDSAVPDGYVEYIKPLLEETIHLSRL
ncbi:hypothetical protein AgCh_027635 [Apium graveolens]